MAFILTRYIYPIEKEILLSKELDYRLDNPRTEAEFLLIKNFVENSEDKNKDPEYNPFPAIGYGMTVFKKYLKEKDKYAHDFFESKPKVSLIDLVAWSWIIIRYSDNNEFEMVMENRDKITDLIWRDNKKENPFVDNFNQLLNYCYLISLIVENEHHHYRGTSISFLEYPQHVFFQTENYKLFDLLHDYKSQMISTRDGNIHRDWLFFPTIKEKLLQYAQQVDKLLAIQESKKKPLSQNQSPRSKLLFIGDLLKVIAETNDVKVKLLLMVSIIEFMVTRNPNSDRFNVEDSISKQFKLKASILIHLNDKEVSLDFINENLNNFYKQRSNVAHGNFIGREDEDSYVDSVHILYDYIKSIILIYLTEREFVDYLKDN
jgi:hypothetical protein